MRILAVNSFVSLDGVTQSPGGPDEDPTGGFTHGGWGVNYFDDEMMSRVAEITSFVDSGFFAAFGLPLTLER